MAAENLRHRTGGDFNDINPTETNDELHDDDEEYYYEEEVEEFSVLRARILRWKAAIAQHGLLSLVIAISPALLHLVDLFFLRSPERASARPSWLTPWSTDVQFFLSSLTISLGTWFTWAEHGLPDDHPTAFVVWFVSFNALSLAWHPIVFGWGAVKLGLFVWALRTLSALAIGCLIKPLNHNAGDLIIKACGILLSLHLFRTTLDLLF